MKPKPGLFYLLVITILFSSCQEEVEIEFNQEQKLCLNCILNPDSLIRARVTLSKGIEDNFDFENIDDASIEVYKDNELVGGLTAQNNGNYFLSSKPLSGSEYKIEVQHPNYPNLSASTKVPARPNTKYTCEIIDSTHIYYPELGLDYYSYTKTHIIDIYDPKGILNYYWIRSFETNAPFIDNFNRSLDSDTKYGYTYPYYMRISDAGYDGETLRLTPTDMLGLFGRIKYVWATDTHYDQYLKSTLKAQLNREDELPFHEPVQIYSNIENGYGIFGSCAITTIIQ